MSTIIDNYSESNHSNQSFSYSGFTTMYQGQSFTVSVSDFKLFSAEFLLYTNGAPTGNVYAYLYAHTGTYGTSSKATGSPLATSNPVDISTIGIGLANKQLVKFIFEGEQQYSLSATNYVIVVKYDGGDSSNYLGVCRDSTSTTHSGNFTYSSNGSTWTNSTTSDLCFYVYGIQKINNIETTGYTNLWESTAPWTESRPWHYPNYTRINNI